MYDIGILAGTKRIKSLYPFIPISKWSHSELCSDLAYAK